jgi:hypothetical protein
MTDTPVATAALAAETEASRALAAEAAPDNPNPPDVSGDPSRTALVDGSRAIRALIPRSIRRTR